MTASSTLWLGDPRAFNPALVGGKVANLSRLARMGYRVPDGFCVTTHAFELALAEGCADVCEPIRDEIAASYYSMTTCHSIPDMRVAVRSSAVDEDGSTASFAGQHETYLNIVGVDAVIGSVARCWASARSERALAYRQQQGLAENQIRLAVFVQQLVASDVSAVVFSANPVTGERDEVMINASWGLGESIVGGTVTPDAFLVRKGDLTILDRQLADKQRMTISAPHGTREVEVPRLLRTQASLSDEQVGEMAQLARALEAAMGYAVDIECAYADGKLYLLQCRPITTL